MSGIFGLWNLDGRPADRSELARLSATLAHRGHDGEGMELSGPVGLACRISRVTREAATETQPLVDPTGTILVFDGRLDNRDELLTALRRDRTISDDSPDPVLVLAAYRTFGDAFPERLNGDFALGLFDPSRTQMLLARDAVGVRPLYFYASRTLFLFASEVKALLAHASVVSQPDDDVLADFLFRRLAGEDVRGRTFFRDIFSVLPSHLAVVTPDKVLTRRYWDFDPARQVRLASFEAFAEAFCHYFTQAVRRRMRSVAPVAVAVSGGLDSSAVFCVGETIRRSEPCQPAMLGASYTFPDGAPSDEKAFLVQIERAYGLKIARLENLPAGITDACAEAVWHSEAPFLDGQWNTTHAFLAGVRQLGARVLLTGHWGDQFLFDDAYLVDLCRRGAWREAWRHVNEYGRWVDISERLLKRRFFVAMLKHHAPGVVVSALTRVRNQIRPPRELRPWYTETFRKRASNGVRPPAKARQSSVSAHARSLHGEARSRYHVLCMELNSKVAAMHGLEMAFPFLDRDLIAFLMAIPGEIQSWKGVHKGILRHALRGLLPEAIAGRVSKADFTDVVNAGMAKDYDRVMRYLDGGMVTKLGYARADRLKEFARAQQGFQSTTSEVSWALGDLFAFELWLQGFFGPDRRYQQVGVC